MNYDCLGLLIDSLEEKGIPGSSVIVRQNGREIYRHSAGYADQARQVPFTAQTPCYVYSISKTVTCTAALQLYEQGAYLLDEPVHKYLPEFRHMRVRHTLPNGIVDVHEAKKPITIRHLFTMTAGLSYDLNSPSLQEARKKPMTTREGVAAIAREPLLFEPGEHWYYSLAHDVLGALVEVWSGKRLGEYMEEAIFRPIGMENTCFHAPKNGAALSTLFWRNTQTHTTEAMTPELIYKLGSDYESGGAGLISTAEDMALFADMLSRRGLAANGARILSSFTVDLMRLNQLNEPQMKDYLGLDGYAYGLGVRTMANPALAGVSPNCLDFGWSGAAGAYLLAEPVNQISIYYAQHVHYLPEGLHFLIRNMVYAGMER